MTEPTPTQGPPTNVWEFAHVFLSEWRKTVSVILLILLLGWPATVIKHWGQDLGIWTSFSARDGTTRQLEHQHQREILLQAQQDRTDLKKSFQELLANLADHNKVALQRDGVILFFARDLCYSKYGKSADICETLADIPTTTHHKK